MAIRDLSPIGRAILRRRLAFMDWRRDLYVRAAYALPAGRIRDAFICRSGKMEDQVDSCRHFLGRCESCGKILLAGDSGYAYADRDPIVCAADAPTWTAIDDPGGWEEPEDYRAFLADKQRHIDAGGSADDPIIRVL